MYRFLNKYNSIKSTRAWVTQQIEQIEQISNDNHRMILICSLIDAFAQHEANYHPRKNAEQFADFLLKYSSEHISILSSFCPSTLYYHSQEYLPKDTTLNFCEDETIFADDKIAISEANRILSLLPLRQQNLRAKQHRYAQLIYAMRNKLAHELVIVGCEVSFITADSDPIPHMIYGIPGYPACWLLHIPEKLVFDVAQSSIANYLDECEKEGKNPLHNNSMERLCYKAWYEE